MVKVFVPSDLYTSRGSDSSGGPGSHDTCHERSSIVTLARVGKMSKHSAKLSRSDLRLQDNRHSKMYKCPVKFCTTPHRKPSELSSSHDRSKRSRLAVPTRASVPTRLVLVEQVRLGATAKCFPTFLKKCARHLPDFWDERQLVNCLL